MSLTWRHAMTSKTSWCHEWRPDANCRIIFFVSHIFRVDKFNEIEICFVACTVDLVGQSRLTNKLAISISVIGCARNIFLVFCFYL